MQSVDQKIYRMLVEQDQKGAENEKPKEYGSAFIVHLLFKAIPIALMLLRGVLSPLLSKTVIIELVLLFVVLDFWLTKNITGKRMLGIRWSFEENQFGDEKFQYEGRVNEEYVSSLSSKLFWLIQIIYTAIPVFFIIFGIISVTILKLNLDDILLYAAILIGGASNLFFFWRANSGVHKRRAQLNSKLGGQFCNQMGNATIVSYV